MLEKMEFDFSQACRLSLNLSQLTSLRGHPQAFSFTYGPIHKRRDSYTTTVLPIHTLTHLDLPWSSQEILSPPNIDFGPRVFQAIILDFTFKQEKLSQFLVEDASDFLAEKHSQLDLGRIKNGEHLWRILQDLAISWSDLRNAIESIGMDIELSQTMILVRTDWSFKFNKYNVSFNNPALEVLSALLCHPFMNRQAVLELIAANVSYFGHDLPSLENPLYFADASDVHPFVKQAREYARIDDLHFEERNFDTLFLREEALSKERDIHRHYMKNLDMQSTDDCYLAVAKRARRAGEHLIGNLLVVPIPTLRDSLGIACEVYFQPTIN